MKLNPLFKLRYCELCDYYGLLTSVNCVGHRYGYGYLRATKPVSLLPEDQISRDKMKKRFKIIAWLAAVTVIGILVFQTYWVYNSYKTGERNFNTTVLNALYKSIDEYPLSVSKLPYGLQSKTPYLPLMNLIHQRVDKKHGPKLYRKDGSLISIKDTAEVYSGNGVEILPVSSDNLLAVQQLVAQLLTEQEGKPIILDTLTRLFKKELLEKEINLPFKLTLLQPHEHASPRQIASNVPFTKDNRLVAVEMAHTFQKYFRDRKPPILAVWGSKDPFFSPPGAEGYKKDDPNTTVKFYDTGHFALETHGKEIGQDILNFMAKLPQ